ncbi:MAG TPA: hypothetical protein EYP10_09840 [Armatimonadetes bacterium]|nr:hypothetical protein [Armatimonadota bacterium]
MTDVEKVWLQQDAVDLLWKFLTPQQKHQLVNGFIRIRELTDEQQFLCSYILALMSANALWEIYRTVSSKQVAIAQMEQYAILPPIGKRVGGPVRVRCGNFQMEFGLRLTWRILQRTQELTAGAQ